MQITGFSARNFRNLNIECAKFEPGLNILHGKNAQGKTNIIEAIYFCAFGRAFRAKSDAELVNWDENDSFVRIDSERGGSSFTTDVSIERLGKKAAKSFLFDKVPVKHLKDLFGKLLVVLFGPMDLRLIKDGPSERRRFLDMEICQLSPVYYNDLKEYHRILRHRNALLKSLQKDRTAKDTLFAWDEQLARFSGRIGKTRSGFVERLGAAASDIYRHISGGEHLEMEYRPSLVTCDSLKTNWDRDIYRGATGDGAHGDEIEFRINGQSARSFASQGQQRSAALSAKLAEITIIKETTGEEPVLLLDDVLSELDSRRREFLFSFVRAQQTILTSTGLDDALQKISGRHNVMYVDGGRICQIKGAKDD